jgi:hypothetical protein
MDERSIQNTASKLSIWTDGKTLDPLGVKCATHVVVDTDYTFDSKWLGGRPNSCVRMFLGLIRSSGANIKFTFISNEHDRLRSCWAKDARITKIVVPSGTFKGNAKRFADECMVSRKETLKNTLRDIQAEWPSRLICFSSLEALAHANQELAALEETTLCRVSVFTNWEAYRNMPSAADMINTVQLKWRADFDVVFPHNQLSRKRGNMHVPYFSRNRHASWRSAYVPQLPPPPLPPPLVVFNLPPMCGMCGRGGPCVAFPQGNMFLCHECCCRTMYQI